MQAPRQLLPGNQSDDRLAEYLRNTANKYPRRLVRRFVNYLNTYDPRHLGTVVVDIGCNTGNEVCYYALNGQHKIIALDFNPSAIAATTAAVKQRSYTNVEIRLLDITAKPIPVCDVASATFFMPFIHPAKFKVTWENNIVPQIKPGGYFIGHFFGPNHQWNYRKDMTFLSEAQVRLLFDKNSSQFEGLKFFKETQKSVPLAKDNPEQAFFHFFKVVARKKGGKPLELTAEEEQNVAKDFFRTPF